MFKFLAIVGLSTSLLAQAPGSKSPQKVEADGAIARRSFQELLNAHDHAILEALNGDHTYACFRPKSDEFLLVMFDEPLQLLWEQKPNTSLERQSALISFDHYKDGSIASTGVGISVFSYWERVKGSRFQTFHGETDSGSPDKGNIDIDDSEFSVEETYKNAAGGETTYRFTLRRSTGRFTESYTIKPFIGESTVDEDAGRCSVFLKGKPISTAMAK